MKNLALYILTLLFTSSLLANGAGTGIGDPIVKNKMLLLSHSTTYVDRDEDIIYLDELNLEETLELRALINRSISEKRNSGGKETGSLEGNKSEL